MQQINYSNFFEFYPIGDTFIDESIWDKYHEDARREVINLDFGSIENKAVELLTAHFCELYAQTQPNNSGLPNRQFKKFDLDHEGYSIEVADTSKSALSSTRWGAEYLRLLAQITGNQTGNKPRYGEVFCGKRTVDFTFH